MDFEKFEEILICPICQEISSTPIYQCTKGHILCHICIPKVSDWLCPTCRTALPKENIRALGLEQLANSIEVKCKNWKRGCHATFKSKDLKEHLQAFNCDYENFSLCEQFGSKCTVGVLFVEFKEHCFESHINQTNTMSHGKICNIEQSVKWGDLADAENTCIVWEPCHIVIENQVHVLLSNYNGSHKLFQWVILTLPASGKHADASSLYKVDITIEPRLENDILSKVKNTWCGENLDFAKWKNLTNLEICDPTSTCFVPLRFLADFSGKTVDRNKLIKWKLSVVIYSSTMERKCDVALQNSVSSVSQSVLNKRSDNAVVESNSYHKVNGDTGESLRFEIFEGSTCDFCGKTPIKGVVYACTECQDFTACEPCTKQGLHNEHILIRKKYSEIRRNENQDIGNSSATGAVVHQATCDVCGFEILGVRYKCCCCLDLDICEKCEDKGCHDHHWCLRTVKSDRRKLVNAISTVSKDNAIQNFHNVALKRGYRRVNLS